MLTFNKTAVVILAFASGAVFAGTMGPVCTPGSVTIPCPRTAWDIAGRALYLQPSLANDSYLGHSMLNSIDRYDRINYNWGWGFELEGSYHFSTGNDLNLNWYHWNSSSSRTLPGSVIGPDAPAGSTDIFSVQPKWDAVNLEFGQHVELGEFEKVRFHGGVAYARIVATSILSGPLIRNVIESYNTNRTYNGFGPRVGADLFYNFANGLNLYAKGASAILVGTASFNEVRSLLPFFVGNTLTSIGRATEVVPELEGKLGATYTYTMPQGDLSLDAGWMWINYFNVLNNAIASSPVRSTDFALQGPFVGLKWVGNIA